MPPPRNPNVTMEDVAKRAGVSRGTVSNVLRGLLDVPVAEPTRKRVLAAVEELGYTGNAAARALAERRTRTIGVLIQSSVNPFFALLAFAIERRARVDGFGVLVADTYADRETEAMQARALVSRQVDGVILGPVTAGSSLPIELVERGIPVVCAGFDGDDERLAVVRIDDGTAMEAVVDHLCALGHRRIAFAPLELPIADIGRRPVAFRQALERRGLSVCPLDGEPTAICCANDVVAIELMSQLAREGTHVPGDVSVVGFDDIPLASNELIGLTTVSQEIDVLGNVAAEILLEAIAAEQFASRRVILPPRLVPRRSSGPARRSDS